MTEPTDPLAAMEARLMGRITTMQEAIIERIRGCETQLRVVVTNLELVTTILTDLTRRVGDLEQRP